MTTQNSPADKAVDVPEFSPEALLTAAPKPKYEPRERIFGRVVSYDLPNDAPHSVLVRRLDQEEDVLVRVRLTTVDERCKDFPVVDPKKVESSYATGQVHRESLADKSKKGIELIAFDDSRAVGVDDKNVPIFRSHWPDSMAAEPGAEVMSGVACIKLRPENGDNKAVARIEMIRGSEALSSATAADAFLKAASLKDDNGNARDPFIVLRASLDGRVIASPRIYPAKMEDKRFDQNLGSMVTFLRAADAEKTLEGVMDGHATQNQITDTNNDLARVMMAALLKEPMPVINAYEYPEKAVQLYSGILQDKIKVELISLEQIDFGKAAGASYLAKAARPQFAPYAQVQDGKIKDGFAKTVIAIQRHADGEPYAIYASPMAMYPRAKQISEVKLDSAYKAPKADLTADAEVESPRTSAPIASAIATPLAAPEPAMADEDDYDHGMP